MEEYGYQLLQTLMGEHMREEHLQDVQTWLSFAGRLPSLQFKPDIYVPRLMVPFISHLYTTPLLLTQHI